jgi:hypothetical protein
MGTNERTNNMTTENQELLPCAHCGGTKAYVMVDVYADQNGYRVKCDTDYCWMETGHFDTREEARVAWNHRAAPAGGDGSIEELLAALEYMVDNACSNDVCKKLSCGRCEVRKHKKLIERVKTESAVSTTPLPGGEWREA